MSDITNLTAKSIVNQITELSKGSAGEVFFVNNSTTAKFSSSAVSSDTPSGYEWGKSPEQPFSTIDYAIGQCKSDRGDIIFVLPGHSETHAAANAGATGAITLDVEGVAIVGLGFGDSRPKLLANFAVSTIDLIEATAASCVIKNLIFLASTTAAPESRIDIADTHTVVEGCTFYCGAYDAESIRVTAAGDESIIKNNEVFVTADGPNAFLLTEAAVDKLSLIDNYINGGSATYQWDDFAFDMDAAANTLMYIKGNEFLYGHGIGAHANTTGIAIGNVGGGPYDLGDMVPISGSGDSISIVAPDGNSGSSNVDAMVGDVFFVDSNEGSDANGGDSPMTAFATLYAAIPACTANNHDTIICMPGHSELCVGTIAATQPDVDIAGIRIVGVGTGELMPSFANAHTNGTSATLRIDADDVEISGLRFLGNTAGTGASIGAIEINSGADDLYLHDCLIEGTTAEDAQGITILGTSDGIRIENNVFKITGNGPNYAIYSATGACSDLRIVGNYFQGSTVTNSWDDAIIYSDQTETGILIENNIFNQVAASKHAIEIADNSATGLIKGNSICGHTELYGISAQDIAQSNNFFENDSGEILKSGIAQSTGKYVFVDSGNGSATASGLTPGQAVSSLSAAEALVSNNAGDVIVMMEGHSEAITLANTIAWNISGVRVIGLGTGNNRPAIGCDTTAAYAGSMMTITADNVSFENIRIAAGAGGANNVTAQIAIATGSDNISFIGCDWEQGAYDLIGLSYAGTSAGHNFIDNNIFVSANGPNNFLSAIAGVQTRMTFRNNVLSGGSTTNSWDDGVILSDQANVAILIEDNRFLFGVANSPAIELSGASTGLIKSNFIANYTEGYGIDAGSCATIGNEFSNDGRILLKGLPYATGKYIYVDSGVVNAGDGLSPDQAVNDLVAGLALATTSVGDVIVCMPGHSETLTLAAHVDVNKIGVSIIGLGNGDLRPTFIPDNTAAYAGGLFTVTVDDVLIQNLKMGVAVAAANGVQSLIDLPSGANDITIKDCIFDQAAYDLIAVDFVADATDVTVENCEFRVSANGPTAAIAADGGVVVDLKVRNNSFNGLSLAAAWDNGAIYSDQVNTGVEIINNKLLYAAATAKDAIQLSGAATGIISDNLIMGLDVNYSIDPGACATSNNHVGLGADGGMAPAPLYSAYDPVLGYKVSYTAGDVLDTVQNAVFTIAGGKVIVTHLSMEITNANCSAGASTCQFILDSTLPAGKDYTICANTTDIDAAVIGAIYSITGEAASAMTGTTGSANGSGGCSGMISPLILSEGQIDILTGFDSGSGGALPLFEIWYKPLDAGATIVQV